MPEYQLAALLQPRLLWLAVAESCTGGLIAHRITNVPGSSAYFERGLVTYSNRAKIDLLGVSDELLQRCGAVSAEVAEAMAAGLMVRTGAQAVLAVTGIAGPGGGSGAKPVGLVYVAGAVDGLVAVERHHFKGDRLQVKEQAAQKALELLVRLLAGSESGS
ncbi:MAG: CinA family protein [Deltaproteobacteria bacterium]|nr:CinA family protein [Candidatus Anaeroferrophillus wilburensis]MBN2888628.1 CinA family protein [Deltaproteobacteria bacterium]